MSSTITLCIKYFFLVYNLEMKEVKCLDCEIVFKDEQEMDMLVQMQKHYYAKHNEIITKVSEEGKVAWMIEFTKRWNTAKIN